MNGVAVNRRIGQNGNAAHGWNHGTALKTEPSGKRMQRQAPDTPVFAYRMPERKRYAQ